jgi:hypothetical protein
MQREPSWLEKLSRLKSLPYQPTYKPTRKVDLWKRRLVEVRGKTDFDGVERIPTERLCDILEIPRGRRGVRVYTRLTATMAELGWTPVRARGMTPGASRKTRGYERRPARDKTCPPEPHVSPG